MKVPKHILETVPEPEWTSEVIAKSAYPLETVVFMTQIARECSFQVRALAEFLRGETTLDTLENIWEYIRENVEYTEDNGEELRSPARTIWEGKGDCDCQAILAASLCIENGIVCFFRLADYTGLAEDEYEHTYLMTRDGQGNDIALDCVPEIEEFGQEHEPYKKIYDHEIMNTTYLKGIRSIRGIEQKVGFAIMPTEESPEAVAEATIDAFWIYLSENINNISDREVREKEAKIASNLIALFKGGDAEAFGQSMTEAIQTSVFGEAYQDISNAIMIALEDTTLKGLGNIFSKIADSVGTAFQKVGSTIDVIGGGAKKRAKAEQESNERLATLNVQAEKLRMQQAEQARLAEEAKASAVAVASQQKMATNNKEGEPEKEKSWFAKNWIFIAVGAFLLFIAGYFLFMRGSGKDMKGVKRRRRSKQVKGVPPRKRRRTVGKAKGKAPAKKATRRGKKKATKK
jgi:hypothetical protein